MISKVAPPLHSPFTYVEKVNREIFAGFNLSEIKVSVNKQNIYIYIYMPI
jgi:hypothetical protein